MAALESPCAMNERAPVATLEGGSAQLLGRLCRLRCEGSRQVVEPGTWSDPRRRGSWSGEVWPHGPPRRPFVRAARFSVGVLGWPLILAFSLALSPELALVRALSVACAIALLVGERWREAEKRRQEEEMERFLRALEPPSSVLRPPSPPASALPPRPMDHGPYASTVDACLDRNRARARGRRRLEGEQAPVSTTNAISRRAEAPTRIERAAERIATVPDSERTIHVGLGRVPDD